MIEAIEKRRRELGVTYKDMDRASGLSNSYFWGLVRGKRPVTQATLSRLKLALSRLARNPNAGDGKERHIDLVYRFAVAWISDREGFDAALVLASEPARRATHDEQWAKAARIRRLAIYVVNQFGGINQADLAVAAGMSKAAVCQLIKEIEEERDEKGTAAQLDALQHAITGVWW